MGYEQGNDREHYHDSDEPILMISLSEIKENERIA